MSGLDKLVEELGGNFLLGGAVIQFSDATFTGAFKTTYDAGAAAEREAICALLGRLVDTYESMDRQGSAEDIRKLIQHIRARGNDAT
jgi:hypothetical protein